MWQFCFCAGKTSRLLVALLLQTVCVGCIGDSGAMAAVLRATTHTEASHTLLSFRIEVVACRSGHVVLPG